MRILFLALLLLLSLGWAISAALHLGMFTATHLSFTHLLIALHLIHRVLLVMLTARLSHFAGVHHLRLVTSHVLPVALVFVLHFVFVACDFSGSGITSALPIAFAHVVAIVFTFPCSRTCARSHIGTFFSLSHGARFVRAFSSSRSCALALALV
jgi:hypothetical protein